jgi:hypothetical protein
MRHRNVHFCGAYGLHTPHSSKNSVAHIICMRHRNIFVENAFLNTPQNPFRSIRVFLPVMERNRGSGPWNHKKVQAKSMYNDLVPCRIIAELEGREMKKILYSLN